MLGGRTGFFGRRGQNGICQQAARSLVIVLKARCGAPRSKLGRRGRHCSTHVSSEHAIANAQRIRTPDNQSDALQLRGGEQRPCQPAVRRHWSTAGIAAFQGLSPRAEPRSGIGPKSLMKSMRQPPVPPGLDGRPSYVNVNTSDYLECHGRVALRNGSRSGEFRARDVESTESIGGDQAGTEKIGWTTPRRRVVFQRAMSKPHGPGSYVAARAEIRSCRTHDQCIASSRPTELPGTR